MKIKQTLENIFSIICFWVWILSWIGMLGTILGLWLQQDPYWTFYPLKIWADKNGFGFWIMNEPSMVMILFLIGFLAMFFFILPEILRNAAEYDKQKELNL